ncbi:extracellular solute-binding protein [Paenibacillus sp. GCM10023248]|uniref:extracellular solute-binding protein n=1 Tax=Bacillales TaxID=1385 RepID=UPI002378EB83|nr:MULTISPECIES: extracellular solute-binding protein [Bacillales]MDD9265588.1 extracellular solute-binding protein [Paenibacillus sp. MAHUQ-63]MDR6878826.1 putative aldouronate transport system substrate-binding protein [Bacillus sp. 3255]
MSGSRTTLTVTALVLACALLLASCKGIYPAASSPAESTAPAKGAPLIEVLVAGSELPDAQDDDIKHQLDSVLGIDLHILQCLGDACRNQLNIRLAEGNPPDLFYVDRRTLTKLVKQDALLDLSPYVDLLKPAIDFAGGGNPTITQYNGKQYGIARNNTAFQYTYWARKDWLDRLGLQPPGNLEELKTVAKAMTAGDPDGNGIQDTYGFSGAPYLALGPIFGAFGTTYPGHFYQKNGALMNSLYDPNMKPAISYIQSLIQAGAVDPDFLSNMKNQHEMKAFQGQIGLFYYNWPNIINDNKVKEWKPYNPAAEWIQLPSPSGPGGTYTDFYDPGATNMLVMSGALARNPAKLDKIIKLINYVSSPEGNRLVMYGLEGKHYAMRNGSITPTDSMSDVKYAYLYQLTGRDEMVYLRTKFPKQEPYFTYAMNQPRLEVLDSFIDPPADYVPDEANRYITEELYKFIYGKRDLATYDEFLRTLENDYHYKQYLEAAEEQLKEQGLLSP